MEKGKRSIISNFLGKDSGNEMWLLGDRDVREGRKDVRCHPGAVGRGWMKTGNCGGGPMSEPEGAEKGCFGVRVREL